MRILDGNFVKSVTKIEERKGITMPEVCFVGRSNVGKSSLLNTLARRKMARTGSTPGATRLINLYDIRYEFEGKRRNVVFSDFPGFGYSKVSRQLYQNWQDMVESYMIRNEWIVRVLWALDVRREFDEMDYMLLDWLKTKALPFSLVITKTDKEGRGKLAQKKDRLQKMTGSPDVFLFSSKDGYGRNELLFHIAHLID
jgi:GTP-binding protein